MDYMDYIIDFHKDAARQGPGSDEHTLKALSYIPGVADMKSILDIGCGTGAQTLALAGATNAHITAIDLLPDFLHVLERRAREAGFAERIRTMEMSMDAITLAQKSFDIVWAESCIYHMGFWKGLKYWKRFLKPGRYLVVSEICWLTDERPTEIEEYWTAAYAEIDTIKAKLDAVNQSGYTCLGHFVLPEQCWTDNYYSYIRGRANAFADAHNNTPEVQAFIQESIAEADLYEKYKDYYSYVFFVMSS